MRRLALAVALLAAACAPAGAHRAGGPPAVAAGAIGRSVEDRPITFVRRGDPAAPVRILVVGSVHGDEPAGMAVVRALRRAPLPPHTALWLVPTLNPDGVAAGTRVNARGVDLNRNFPAGWRAGRRAGNSRYPGPRPLSEPESRAARRLIRAVRPTATVWYHQALDLVWAAGASRAAGRRYAAVAGVRMGPRRWLPGAATRWQNVRLGQIAFVVELPAGRLTPKEARRHARAVRSLAR